MLNMKQVTVVVEHNNMYVDKTYPREKRSIFQKT